MLLLLIDGAEGWARLGPLCFKDAVQIVDFFHALEPAGEVLGALLGSKDHPEYAARLHRWAERLLADEGEKLLAETRQEATAAGGAQAVQKTLGYFAGNVARMPYGTFRRQGFFIGSGVIEAGCKNGARHPRQAGGHVPGRSWSREHSGLPGHPRQSPSRELLEIQAQPARRPQ